MLTAFLVFFPLAAALLLHFAKGGAARALALGAALLEFVVAVYAAISFSRTGSAGLDLNINWIPSAGINFHLGIDGLSLCLVLLTTFLVPIILLTAFRHEEYENPGAFYALMLFMQTGLLGVFTAMDAFVFYFFWEVALIPIYFLAGAWSRSDRRIQITFKFFLYTIIGSLFMLAGRWLNGRALVRYSGDVCCRSSARSGATVVAVLAHLRRFRGENADFSLPHLAARYLY
jgi:NADH-quinone oxidoreductase subunit M